MERLAEIVAGPILNGFDRRFGGILVGHQNDFGARVNRQNRLQQVGAANPRHHQVEQHDARPGSLQNLQTVLG